MKPKEKAKDEVDDPTTRQEEEEEEDEEVQDVKPKKQNTCNRQIRSMGSDANDPVSNEKRNNKKNNEVPS